MQHERLDAAGIETQYYTAAVHQGPFALSGYVCKLMP